MAMTKAEKARVEELESALEVMRSLFIEEGEDTPIARSVNGILSGRGTLHDTDDIPCAVIIYNGFAMLAFLFGVGAVAMMFAWPRSSDAPQWLDTIILYGLPLCIPALLISAAVAITTGARRGETRSRLAAQARQSVPKGSP